MCFSISKPETPPMPTQEDPNEGKGNTYRQNRRRKGYSSTILAGELQGNPASSKRLLGE